MAKVKIVPRRYRKKSANKDDQTAKGSPVAAVVDLCEEETPVYKFSIKGHCQAQARHVPGRNHAKYFDPSGAAKKKLAAALAMVTPKGKGALFPSCPVELKVWFLMEQPVKNFVGRDPIRGVLNHKGKEVAPCIRPDVDNLLKFLMDAMNGIVYSDDCQVVKVTMYKMRNKSAEAKTVVHASEFVESQEEAMEDMDDMEDMVDMEDQFCI